MSCMQHAPQPTCCQCAFDDWHFGLDDNRALVAQQDRWLCCLQRVCKVLQHRHGECDWRRMQMRVTRQLTALAQVQALGAS